MTYFRKELEKREELINKISFLKPLESLNETFEDFINKQEKLNFKFEIKNEDLIYYGSSKDYDNYYENLKKKKSFKINPKEIFLENYIKEKQRLKIEIEKSQINRLFFEKKNIINNYFASLKFYQDIDSNMDLKIKIETILKNYKLGKENELKEFFEENIKKKHKEWDKQIELSKWNKPVHYYGSLNCVDGIKCNECKKSLYWVDIYENYVICKGCNKVRKLSEKIAVECVEKRSSGFKYLIIGSGIFIILYFFIKTIPRMRFRKDKDKRE